MVKSKVILASQIFTLCFSAEIHQSDDNNITVGHKIEVPKGLSQQKRKDSNGCSYNTNRKILDIVYHSEDYNPLLANKLTIENDYNCRIIATTWNRGYTGVLGLFIQGEAIINGTLIVNCHKRCVGDESKEQGGINLSKGSTIHGKLIINGSILDYNSDLNIEKEGLFQLKSENKLEDEQGKYHAGLTSLNVTSINFSDGSTFDVSELESFKNIKLGMNAKLNFHGGSTIKLPCMKKN